MLSCQVLTGPRHGDEPTLAGAAIQWVLLNDGTVAWPEGTSLRLVAGPVLLCPAMGMPAAAPGQTVVVDLEVHETGEPAEVCYSLVTPCAQPFGELLQLRVAPKPAPSPAPAPPKPVCMVVASPMDGLEDQGIDALQGELKTVEWTLANTGHAVWPEDARMTLFYNTPGFANLPTELQLPAAAPGMTVQAGITVLMPEAQGYFKAMWAVTSASHADFGDILVVEFNVDEFPFMEWMLAEELRAETASEASTSQEEPAVAPEPPTSKPSAVLCAQQHLVPGGAEVQYLEECAGGDIVSLGCVSGLRGGMPWVLELMLANDGGAAWPANVDVACCFGQDMGCARVPVSGEPVQPGQSVVVRLELLAPEALGRAAWTLASGDAVFGPVMMLEVCA